MPDISEEFKKRMGEKPDIHTLKWWDAQFKELLAAYRGIQHAMNCVLAHNEDLAKTNKELVQTIQAMEAAGVQDRAKIGELQTIAELDRETVRQIHVRLDRQGEFLTELKKKEKSSGK